MQQLPSTQSLLQNFNTTPWQEVSNLGQAKDIPQMSRQYFNSISPSRDANDEILEKNNFRKGTSILSNLYRIDDRSKLLIVLSLV